jgi:hypothetical protein
MWIRHHAVVWFVENLAHATWIPAERGSGVLSAQSNPDLRSLTDAPVPQRLECRIGLG